MATVNVTKGGTSLHPAVRGRNLYVIEAVVD